MINMLHKMRALRIWQKIAALAIVGVLILLAGQMFIAIYSAHVSNEAFDQFGKYVIATNYQNAYGMTSNEFHMATSESQFEAQQRTLVLSFGPLRNITRDSFDTERQMGEWTSTISATFVFERADRHFDVVMKRGPDGWKVYGYKEE